MFVEGGGGKGATFFQVYKNRDPCNGSEGRSPFASASSRSSDTSFADKSFMRASSSRSSVRWRTARDSLFPRTGPREIFLGRGSRKRPASRHYYRDARERTLSISLKRLSDTGGRGLKGECRDGGGGGVRECNIIQNHENLRRYFVIFRGLLGEPR